MENPTRIARGHPIQKGNGGNQLIQSLESYIVPLIQGGSVQEEANSSGSELSSEATDLLAALQRFVVSLTGKKAPQEVNIVNPRRSQSSSTPIPVRRPLPSWILEKARYRVFNKMPIRMLAFSKDGTKIRLVERPEILRIVSQKMEEIFYTDKISRISPAQAQADNGDASDDIDEFVDQHCKFAILSHTWLRESPGEVTFTDWTAKTFDPSLSGYRKLEMFCRVAARNHGMTLGWMDTCCIDKTSSSELDESIRSMFRWYKSSTVCVTYLADTMDLEEMHKDTWFTRGWTLQELIAPKTVKFYGSDWRCLAPGISIDLSDKYDRAISKKIFDATSITEEELRHIRSSHISRRMQWAAKRNVTREEDASYSLMGIFNVSFSTAYGEGADAAFTRLVQEILNRGRAYPNVLDIVNYGGLENYLRMDLVPDGLQCFTRALPDIKWPHGTYEPVVLTPLGMKVSVLLMPAMRVESTYSRKITPRGHYYSPMVNISGCLPYEKSDEYNTYNVLDSRLFDSYGRLTFSRPSFPDDKNKIHIFGVLNFEESMSAVQFKHSQVCFALVLVTNAAGRSVGIDEATFNVATMKKPITFKLQTIGGTYNILKKDLRKHGMTLRSMYL